MVVPEQRGIFFFPIVSTGKLPEQTLFLKTAVLASKLAALLIPVKASGSSENWKK